MTSVREVPGGGLMCQGIGGGSRREGACPCCPGPHLVCFSTGMERAVSVLMVKGVFIFIRRNKLRSRRARQQT